jgi:hypothetical protein
MTFTVRIPQLGVKGEPGNLIIQKTNVAPGAEDGAVGDVAVRFDDNGDVFVYGKKTPGGWPTGRSVRGPTGMAGWSPIITTVAGPSSAVLRLIDWVGGEGDKPGGVGKYLGASGLVEDIEDAVAFAFSAIAGNIFYDNVGSGMAASDIQAAVDEMSSRVDALDNGWATQPIGVPIPIFDQLVAGLTPPTDRAYRYVMLTAGKTGAGGYNNGILTGETVSGSAPLVNAYATISLASSPLNGRLVQLINTEGRFLRAGLTPGGVENDQMQRITGTLAGAVNRTLFSNVSSGVFTATGPMTTGYDTAGPAQAGYQNAAFDSGNSTDARAGTETRPKNVQATYYMRIK